MQVLDVMFSGEPLCGKYAGQMMQHECLSLVVGSSQKVSGVALRNMQKVQEEHTQREMVDYVNRIHVSQLKRVNS